MEETAIFAVALVGFAFAIVSRRIESGPLSAPIIFTATGIAIGPLGLGLIDVSDSVLLEVVATTTLALVLFEDAASIKFQGAERRSLMRRVTTRLLGLALPVTILAGAIIGKLVFPDLAWAEAFVLALVLAPTDAALSQPVFAAKGLPGPVQNALDAESGLNDGICLPLLLMALAISVEGFDMLSGSAWGRVFLGQLVMAPVYGAVIGFIGARLIATCRSRREIGETWHSLSILALAGIAFVGSELFGGNGFLSAWAAGLVFGLNSDKEASEPLTRFVAAEGQLLIQASFVLFGAMIVPQIMDPGAALYLLYGVLTLTVLRMAPVAVSLAGLGLAAPSKTFIGWFGPRGIPSILYLVLVVDREGFAAAGRITDIAAMTILLSILLHGVTATWGVAAYKKWLAKSGREY